MILTILYWVTGILVWVIGMGLTARITDDYDDAALIFFLWWLILPVMILQLIYDAVSGQ